VVQEIQLQEEEEHQDQIQYFQQLHQQGVEVQLQ
jgi:hypothetical protein